MQWPINTGGFKGKKLFVLWQLFCKTPVQLICLNHVPGETPMLHLVGVVLKGLVISTVHAPFVVKCYFFSCRKWAFWLPFWIWMIVCSLCHLIISSITPFPRRLIDLRSSSKFVFKIIFFQGKFIRNTVPVASHQPHNIHVPVLEMVELTVHSGVVSQCIHRKLPSVFYQPV